MPKGRQASLSQVVFLPQHKQFAFHRINIEYLVSLKTLNQQSTLNLLQSGLRNNMNLHGSEHEACVHSLRPQLDAQAWHITQQGRQFRKQREDLKQHFSKRDFRLYRANCEVDFAHQRLIDSLNTQNTQADQQVSLAEHMLRDALQANANNYQAHFELAWIYSGLQHKFTEAAFHFETAARLAKRHNDDLFTVLALRHLADTRYMQGQHGKALELAFEVQYEAHEHNDLEYSYELSRYLAANDEIENAQTKLAQVVTQSPLYYVHAQVEPDFQAHDDVRQMLGELHQNRVRRIQHQVRRTWHESPVSQLQLPDHISPNDLFKQVFEQHSRVMEDLPYTVLSKREEAISDLVVQSSQQRISKEITKRSRSYESQVERKRSKWSWVNKLGGFCLHSAAVLFLAILLFFTARFAANAAGMSGLLSADTYIMPTLVTLLTCLVTGSLLIQFVPWGNKERLRKQVELDNSLLLLQGAVK